MISTIKKESIRLVEMTTERILIEKDKEAESIEREMIHLQEINLEKKITNRINIVKERIEVILAIDSIKRNL